MMKIPLILKITTVLVFFNSFVLFEEFVIDRYGFGPSIPLYRVGNICFWDIVVAIAMFIYVILWHRRDKKALEAR